MRFNGAVVVAQQTVISLTSCWGVYLSTAYQVLQGVSSLMVVLFANQIFHHKSRNPFVWVLGLSARMKERSVCFFLKANLNRYSSLWSTSRSQGNENISRMRRVEGSVYALLGEVQFPMKKPLWDSISSFLRRSKHIIHSLSKTFSDGKKRLSQHFTERTWSEEKNINKPFAGW